MGSLQLQNQQQHWMTFFRVNCGTLFETALLLTADPNEAEASLTAIIDELDVTIPPNVNEVAKLQDELARRVIQDCRQSASSQTADACSMLQEGLRPIIQIDRQPRICFILRTLLGYSVSTCAQMLGVDEYMVAASVEIATLQLSNAASQTRSLREELVRRIVHVTSH